MFLEIVTPEAILFSSEIDSLSVPGVNGEFQMLNNHAPVVSNLKEGTIKIHIHSQSNLDLNELNGKLVPDVADEKILTLLINSGTLELNDNKAIILAD
ncbi:F0F1 ATP synthase subunit epsilon [Polaribacter sp. Z014]|uniref:FoF1 ATP synthase subunit delta/epsilon n=1 Tax=unclassified Polaribacter TaxID=196858 RepID=UPI00193C57E5|nr:MULTISPECIES: F0F1 ATP synthase subunit epsilon [unclassified Polaribacter]MCL7762424.1 F0F1 ATP synthase subunit epsilon [Polaribacter sp. Z014]QVY64155.1 F0F1 ATP synthase subunit epsilon [Polaribacter sp. Q13]